MWIETYLEWRYKGIECTTQWNVCAYIYIYIWKYGWEWKIWPLFFLGRHDGDISLGMEKLMELRNLWPWKCRKLTKTKAVNIFKPWVWNEMPDVEMKPVPSPCNQGVKGVVSCRKIREINQQKKASTNISEDLINKTWGFHFSTFHSSDQRAEPTKKRSPCVFRQVKSFRAMDQNEKLSFSVSNLQSWILECFFLLLLQKFNFSNHFLIFLQSFRKRIWSGLVLKSRNQPIPYFRDL